MSDIALVQRIEVVPSILEVVCAATGMGFAAVARVTDDRWVACSVRDTIAFGLEPGGELPVETTICHEIRSHREPVVIEDCPNDPDYRDHHTPKMYGLGSYIAVPIVLANGELFGTLCAIDPKPRPLKAPHILGMFQLFAQMIAQHIEALSNLETSEGQLISERETGALREEFIAVLGHDLRNPIAGIKGGLHFLRKETLSANGAEILGMMNEAADRMARLVDNVVDFARGRLGGGIALKRERKLLAPVLEQVVSEFRSSQPDRIIETHFDLPEPIDCDHGRIAQLFSNLLGNGLAYGDPAKPLRVTAVAVDDALEIRTVNGGIPIPPETMTRLFSPFARGQAGSRGESQGLGLGLYIAAQVAKAHGGSLTATSDAEETMFTFRMPVSAP